MINRTVMYETRESVAYLTLNRPDTGNAVDLEMSTELKEACSYVKQQDDLRVLVVTGFGDRDFCSGEDAAGFGTIPRGELDRWCNLAEAVSQVEIPVIAAINGNISGIGLAISLACDLRIASENAVFSIQGNSDTYLLPTGLTQWLPRIVGIGKASEMMLVGEPINAQEAHRIGLVHRIVPHADVMAEAEKLARGISSKGPVALKYGKEAVCKGLDMTLEQGLRLECDLYMIIHSTADRREGITSFLQKRTPQFECK